MTLLKRLESPIIIGEISGNHQGNPDKVFELVTNAVECGLKCIKFQLFQTDEVLGNDTHILRGDSWDGDTLRELYTRAETHPSWVTSSIDFLKERKIIYGATISGPKSLEVALSLGCNFLKIASFDALDPLLLQICADENLPVVISDGVMGRSRRIQFLEKLKTLGCHSKFTYLHCSSNYPAEIDSYNLAGFLEDMHGYPDICPGVSDHTLSDDLILFAAGMGFKVFEKHIKLASDTTSVDNFFSESTEKVGDLQNRLDKIFSARDLNLDDAERELNQYQRSCYWSTAMNAGETIEEKNICFRRPTCHTGVTPENIHKIIGKKVLNDVRSKYPVLLSDLAPD